MLLSALQVTVTHVHTFLHTSKFARAFVELLTLVLAVFIGVMVYRHYQPVYTVHQLDPNVQVVTVDKPVLTEKIVTKVLADPKDKSAISALLAENKKLKLSVTELTQTLAEVQSHGTGPVVAIAPNTPPDTTDATAPKSPDPTVANYHFKDWRLDFITDMKTANYNLNQKFEVLTTTGKDSSGQTASITKLYEINETGDRVPVANLKTVDIIADPLSPHWIFNSLNIQGGLAVTRDNIGNFANGGIVAVQWLKHGRTKATEDVTYAILSPAFFFGTKVQDIGLLPASFNLGRIPRQPLTNLWISALVSKSRLGIVFSATF